MALVRRRCRDASEVSYMMDAIKSGSSIRMEEAEMITYEDITFYLGAVLAALLIWELIGLLLERRL